MDDFDDPSPASIERAREAQARERVEAVQQIGGDVIGISQDGRILRQQRKGLGGQAEPEDTTAR